MAVHFTNPFVKPIEYDAGPKYGFIGFPHSPEVPEGWGDPTKNPDGSPITPGTEGGPNPNRFVAYKESAKFSGWKSYRSASRQVAGPIDWKGPHTVPSNTDSKRYVLSYWGPTSRHFNYGQFEYGSDPKHQEIYLNGKLLALAPFPVLGAAIKIFSYQDPTTDVEKLIEEKWLVAILKVGLQDECHMRPLPEPMNYDQVTDETRFAMVQSKSSTYPDGWESVGVMLAPAAARSADTPWFFNESCTEARCLRRHVKNFDPGTGTNIDEDVFVEYKVKITCNENFKNAVFESLGHDPTHKFDYLERTERYQLIWDYLGDPDERWEEEIIEAKVTCDGQMIVAVDFRGNELIKAYYVQNAVRQFQFYWPLGIGANNSGRTDGEDVARGNQASAIAGNGNLPGEHDQGRWVTSFEQCLLRVVNVSSGVTDLEYKLQYVAAMSKTMFDTGVDVNADRILYYWESLFTRLHHLDVRALFMTGRTDSVSNFFGTTIPYRTSTVYNVEWMDAGSKTSDPYSKSEDGNKGTFDIHSRGSTGGKWWVWERTHMDSWPATVSQTISRVTHYGGWLDPNLNASVYTPWIWDNVDSFFATLPESPYMRIWPMTRVFGDELAYRSEALFGVDEGNNFIVNYEYPHPQTLENTQGWGLIPYGDLVEVMTYGDRFYPGGVL